mmetsp:Transcript_2012/g.2324  ORF Transcript_2012/g.2324 Transcript_2012/m.2324 type:complete len:135 (-) Transcript_2012:227-631(-)
MRNNRMDGSGRDELFRSSNRREYDFNTTKEETASFINNHMQVKENKIQEQNDLLDDLHDSVGRFKNQTLEMKNEIEDHLVLINNLDTDLMNSQNALDYVNKRATTLIEKSGGEMRVICILSTICFILFLLVIYS